jgi:hypothetical protein
MDKDAYQPNEIVKINLNFDNKECDEAVKKVTVKFVREVTSVSSKG